MKFLRTSLLVAACAVTMAQVNAISIFGYTFGSSTVAPVEAVVATAPVVEAPVAPVAKSFSARAAESFGTAKDACASLFAKTIASAKEGKDALIASAINANNVLDASVCAKAPWFKSHTSVLTASKVVVASAMLAVTGYLVKKAADKVKAYRNSK